MAWAERVSRGNGTPHVRGGPTGGVRALRGLATATLLLVALVSTTAAAPVLAPAASNSAGRGAAAPSHETRPTAPVIASAEVTHELRHALITTPLRAASRYGFPQGWNTTALAAYAPWGKAYYVAAPPSSVDAINASTFAVRAIPVGKGAYGVAVDGATKEVFVTNNVSNNVTVISTATHRSTANVTVGSDPEGVAFDGTDDLLYVADAGSHAVSVVSLATLSVVATTPVGLRPVGVAWDPATDQVFVTDFGSREVSILNGSTSKVVATVEVGRHPYGVAIDNASDTAYVSNQGSNNVSVIAAATDTLNATVPVPSGGHLALQGIAYDSQHQLMWVASGPVWTVVINTTTNAVVDYVFIDPSGAVYNPDNGDVCVTNSANLSFGCFAFVALSYNGVSAPSAMITFNETGLPAGTLWSVTFDGGSWHDFATGASRTSTIRFGLGIGYPGWTTSYSVSYRVDKVPGYTASPSKGFAVSKTAGSVRITIRFS